IAAWAARLHVVGAVVAPRRSAHLRRSAAPVVLGRRQPRLRGDAVGAARGVLLRNASGDRTSGRCAGPQPDRIPGHYSQAGEDPLMEDTQVHALDYLSVLRRRKWWLIAPILVSVG